MYFKYDVLQGGLGQNGIHCDTIRLLIQLSKLRTYKTEIEPDISLPKKLRVK